MVIFNSGEISSESDVLLIPILSDPTAHPAQNTISVLGVVCRGGDTHVIPIDHLEGRHPFPIINAPRVWVTDKKRWLYTASQCQISDTHDASSIEYLVDNSICVESDFYTSAHRHFHRLSAPGDRINTIIPLVKHAEFIQNYSNHIWAQLDRGKQFIEHPAHTFLSDIAIPSLFSIEKNGFEVDQELFKQFFHRELTQSRTYGEYSLYTTTGRASNKFNGINFASLNKSDGSRTAFVSRHGNKGLLINIDFESFHLRLIADLIEFQLPQSSVHTFFGQRYFQKDELTNEEYEESKRISFRYLYGREKFSDVPEFFKQVYTYAENLEITLKQTGLVTSNRYGKPIYLSNVSDPSIIFNYMVQLVETETILSFLNDIGALLHEKQSVPILYLYDSILIDFHVDEKPLLKEIVKILEDGGRFPVKVSVGSNFHNMRKIK